MRETMLLALLALVLLAPPRFASSEGADACAGVAIDDVRTRAEDSCARRGITCESGALDYVRCVNTAVAAAVRQGKIPRQCRQRVEVTPARCTQLLTPNFGHTE